MLLSKLPHKDFNLWGAGIRRSTKEQKGHTSVSYQRIYLF